MPACFVFDGVFENGSFDEADPNGVSDLLRCSVMRYPPAMGKGTGVFLVAVLKSGVRMCVCSKLTQ